MIAIIGVLAGLLLPALQSAREAARRVTCGSNIRQLGMAMLLHMESQGGLPFGFGLYGAPPWQMPVNNTTYLPTPPSNAVHQWNGFLFTLPYIEQQAYFDRLEPIRNNETHTTRGNPDVPTLLCPSDGNSITQWYGRGRKNYLLNVGDRYTYGGFNAGELRGLFGFQSSITPAQIRDGLSSTLMLSECIRPALSAAPPDGFSCSTCQPGNFPHVPPANDRAAQVIDHRQDPAGCWSRWTGHGYTGGNLVSVTRHSGNASLFGYPGYAVFNTILPPNGPVCAADGQSIGIQPPRSRHDGGVNVTFADGSTRFITDTIDTGSRVGERTSVTGGPSPYGVWGALGTRASADVAGELP